MCFVSYVDVATQWATVMPFCWLKIFAETLRRQLGKQSDVPDTEH